MNEILQNLLVGVTGNALTSILARTGYAAYSLARKRKPIATPSPELVTLLQRALTRSTSLLSIFNRDREAIQRFLTSPDAESIVRQLYSGSLLPGRDKHTDDLIEELTISLSLYMKRDRKDLTTASQQLFAILSDACDQALKDAIATGNLPAHEAQSAARFRVLRDELATLAHNVRHADAREPDINEVSDFEGKYRKQVLARHKTITPPDLYGATPFAIDSIYVMPTFSLLVGKARRDAAAIEPAALLANLHRTVILGTPGGGKSTFAQKITVDLSRNYLHRFVAFRLLTPCLVILRDYGAQKQHRQLSIRQFLEDTAKADYQLQPPAGVFEYLLRHGRLLLIFDGLDELLDTSYRQQITKDIEAFCNLYQNIPVLVTSREVGYDEAPLDPELFSIATIAPFRPKQVTEYVKKWFGANADLTAEEQAQKSAAFLRESAAVPDLCANPLMLALLCNIYRGENYIPKNRPDVYEKCALMLFEKWDKSRNITIHVPFEAHIQPAVKFLAHWIYSDASLQTGVTEEMLVQKTAEYLLSRRFDDTDEALAAGKAFIKFCRGRAWVFTDTGTTKTGDRLYQFTHRTFLEYFTAGHLVRVHPTARELDSVLIPHIVRQEWDVVAQLAVQLQNKNVEGAAEAMLTAIMEVAKRAKESERFSLLSFAIRSLEFLVPAPTVVRQVADMSLRFYVTKPFVHSRRRDTRFPHVLLTDSMTSVAEENRTVIASVAAPFLSEAVSGVDDDVAIRALELWRNSIFNRYRLTGNDANTASADFWLGFSDCALAPLLPRRRQLARTSRRIATDELLHDGISTSEFVQWHGVAALWQFCPYSIWDKSTSVSIVHYLFLDLLSAMPGSIMRPERMSSLLAGLAETLTETAPPWVSEFAEPSLSVFDFETRRETAREKPLAGIEIAGATLAMAPFVEESKEPGDVHRMDWILRGPLAPLQHIVYGFFDPSKAVAAVRYIDRLGLPAASADLLKRWVSKEVSFVRLKRPRPKKRVASA